MFPIQMEQYVPSDWHLQCVFWWASCHNINVISWWTQSKRCRENCLSSMSSSIYLNLYLGNLQVICFVVSNVILIVIWYNLNKRLLLSYWNGQPSSKQINIENKQIISTSPSFWESQNIHSTKNHSNMLPMWHLWYFFCYFCYPSFPCMDLVV